MHALATLPNTESAYKIIVKANLLRLKLTVNFSPYVVPIAQDMPGPAAATRFLQFVVAACFIVTGFADDTKSIVMVESESYVQLDSEKHISALDDSDIWLVEFFSPMCGSCEEFKSTWIEVAAALNGQVVSRVSIF
jgi:hypothetical protein